MLPPPPPPGGASSYGGAGAGAGGYVGNPGAHSYNASTHTAGAVHNAPLGGKPGEPYYGNGGPVVLPPDLKRRRGAETPEDGM